MRMRSECQPGAQEQGIVIRRVAPRAVVVFTQAVEFIVSRVLHKKAGVGVEDHFGRHGGEVCLQYPSRAVGAVVGRICIQQRI